MATTVMAERPTPVRSRATARLVTSHAKAFKSEQIEYHSVVTMSARLRPMRSDSQPAVVAPTNMPTNEADVMRPIVAIDSCHASRTAGRREPEAVEVAELEEKDVAEQPDHAAVERRDGQAIEPCRDRRHARLDSCAWVVLRAGPGACTNRDARALAFVGELDERGHAMDAVDELAVRAA